ncbi:hypothetical protein RHA1_ro08981 (plasmid) [Rhodococcus jostii RHA1]|uniref:Uncharacterized protein n=1 Tax=Rhodococcus jostii (strain RHA1) TaxID=101510 RepID=Q0RXG1_RHOJR|nr:hypothetical protein RHA1_ro08981 [Rhodococcus jostii RHA1]
MSDGRLVNISPDNARLKVNPDPTTDTGCCGGVAEVLGARGSGDERSHRRGLKTTTSATAGRAWPRRGWCRAKLGDQRPVEVRSGIVVEVLERRRGGQAGEPQPRAKTAGLGSVDLDRQHSLSMAVIDRLFFAEYRLGAL